MPQLGDPKPRPLQPCPNLTWANPMPLNGSSSDYIWKPQRHLSLDVAGLQLRRINSAENSRDGHAKIKPLRYDGKAKYHFQWDAYLHGLLIVLVLLLLYLLVGGCFRGQRRRSPLRIVLRCCFGWWKIIQSKLGLTTETWAPDVTIHLPADTTMRRRKSTAESKAAVSQPRSKSRSFSEYTLGKVQAV